VVFGLLFNNLFHENFVGIVVTYIQQQNFLEHVIGV